MFDAYSSWLGIPKERQPPNLYELLAIEPSETDPERINKAADKLLTELRAHVGGPNAESCTKLLDEIAKARDTLLNSSLRRKYDLLLASQKKTPTTSAEPLTVVERLTVRDASKRSSPPTTSVKDNSVKDVTPSLTPGLPPVEQRKLVRLAVALGALVLAVILILLMIQPSGCDERQADSAKPNQKSKSDAKAEDPGALFPVRAELIKPDPDKGPITSAACSPDGRWVAFSYGMGTVVHDSWAKKTDMKYALANAQALAISADGAMLAAALPDGKVFVEKTENIRENVAELPHQGPASALAFSADGKRILTGSSAIPGKAKDGKEQKTAFVVTLWDVLNSKVIRVYQGHSDAIKAVAFADDGLRLFSAASEQGICHWDRAKGALQKSERGRLPFEAVAFRPDGKFALCLAGQDALVLWDVEKGVAAATIPIAAGVSAFSVALAADGKTGAIGLEKDIKVFELASGKEVARLVGHKALVRCLALSADGHLIISGSDDGTVRTWEKRLR